MTGGEWGRIIVAALVGLAGLLLSHVEQPLLSNDRLGALIFLAAAFYGYRVVARHFDRAESGREHP